MLRKKRSSLDVNVIRGYQQPPSRTSQPLPKPIVIPHITTEQFSENSINESTTETSSSIQVSKSMLSNNHTAEDRKKRPNDWRSQAAFELSSSVESEASYIINEFLNRTKNSNDLKYESDV